MCHAPQLDERELSTAIIFAPVGWLGNSRGQCCCSFEEA
jgi:hypothetical protein